MQVFTEITFTDTEISLIRESLSNPLVIKYLRSLAYNAASDAVLDNSRLTSESSEEYKVKNAFLQGTIAAVIDLVDLAEAVPQPD
jgi:hypothetical protein